MAVFNMAHLKLTDFDAYLYPVRIDLTSKPKGAYTATHLAIGTTDSPFTRETTNGLKFVYNDPNFSVYDGDTVITGATNWRSDYFSHILLGYDYVSDRLYISAVKAPAYGSVVSGGERHYYWRSIDGAGPSEMPTQADFIQSLGNLENKMYRIFALLSGSLKGYVEWYNDKFDNGRTYLEVWEGGYDGGFDTIYVLNDDFTEKLKEEIEEDPNDPYTPGLPSEPGGGEGDFDGTSDPIDFPDLPNISATDTGFITLFNPTAAQLKALASYMWSNSLFDLATWKKIFADPMDAILGLTVVPVAVPDGGTSAVKVGNMSTDVNMTLAASQYVIVDCGTLNVNEYWGAYLDYDPYTKAEIYLPYIGTHALSVDDIMGKAIHVKYHVDILSGACAAFVKCGDSVLYTFIGQCASSIPITGSDMTNVINGVISAAASIGSMIATGGASAPLAVPALANTAANGMKPTVEKSGGMSGTGGMLGIQTPYLILTRPNQCLPENQNKFMGYPSFITSKIGSLTGYTEIESAHLDGIPCTDDELLEIESLLKTGVIL
jgi:hypothetical protein